MCGAIRSSVCAFVFHIQRDLYARKWKKEKKHIEKKPRHTLSTSKQPKTKWNSYKMHRTQPQPSSATSTSNCSHSHNCNPHTWGACHFFFPTMDGWLAGGVCVCERMFLYSSRLCLFLCIQQHYVVGTYPFYPHENESMNGFGTF